MVLVKSCQSFPLYRISHTVINLFCITGLIVEEPGGVRPGDTFSPVALAVMIAIGVALLLFIVFFIAALMFGAYQQRRQRRIALASTLTIANMCVTCHRIFI